ncbi:MAG: SpoIVB peptidase [Clostridia bacterium]|nr:SpoIVB peptidase [Clostridia bacterium]
MIKRSIAIFSKMAISFALLLAFSVSVYALEGELIPLGRTTGMKFFTDGAAVISFNEIDGRCPAKEAGLNIGDVILSVNGKDVLTNEELSKNVNNAKGCAVLDILRDGEQMSITVEPVILEEGKAYIGAYVRDSMAGIGTITYVDPETGRFGALGHGVADMDTEILMHVDHGSLMPSSVIGVNKGEKGSAGELKGDYQISVSQGIIEKNTDSGVYGVITDKSMYDGKKTYEIASKDEIKKGKAQIISNVNGTETETYDIEIIRLYETEEGDLKDMMIKVTDEKLIKKTGGIVQGMSGSPIIQDGKLVGAVTHVLISEPTKGYAIARENMLQEAG